MRLPDEAALPTAGRAPSATSADRDPPRNESFSCRQHELQALLASVRSSFSPEQLTTADEEYLRGLHGESDRDPLLPRPLVLVHGGSGMGKSRLLHEVKAVAEGAGVRAKEVFCYERQGIPFLPILRVVKELLCEASDADEIWGQYSHVLARVYPELTHQMGGGRVQAELPGDAGRVQFFDVLTGILCHISRQRPLLLLIHDLHRSDVGTLEFLEYLGRNVFLENATRRRASQPEVASSEGEWKEIGYREGRRDFITEGLDTGETQSNTGEDPGSQEGPRLLVVANLLSLGESEIEERSGPADGIQQRLDPLSQQSFVRTLLLSPLSAEEMGILLTATLALPELPPAVVQRIHEATRGNPLHALDLCRCLNEGGAPGQAASAGRPITIDAQALDRLLSEIGTGQGEADSEHLARALVERRLSQLPDRERELVKLLAALRRPVLASRLSSFRKQTQEQLDASLALLRQRGFVKVLPIQRAPRYFLAHEDYTRCVYAALSEDERLQVHDEIGRTLQAVKEELSEPIRGHEVYEHLSRSARPRDCFPTGLAAARYFAGGYALNLAIAIGTNLLELLAAPEDRELKNSLLAELSRWEYLGGQLAIAKTHIKELIEQADGVEPGDRLLAAMHLATIYRANHEPLKGIKTLNRVPRTCGDALDDRAQARVVALQARLRLDRNDPKRALHLCLRGMRLVENDVEAVAEQIELLEVLAEAHVSRAETGAALPHFQRLVGLLEEAGDEVRLAAVLVRLGRVYYDRGNYFRAARFLFKALDVFQRLGDVQGLSHAYDTLGKVYRNSGDALRGLEYFNRCLRLRERIGDSEGLSPTLNSLGSLYAHAGDYYRAIRYFRRSQENSERHGNTDGLVRAFLHRGWVYAQVGNLKQVESLAKQSLILSQEFDLNPELEGEGHRLQGNLFFQRGDWKRAERELRKAVESAAKSGRKKGEAAALLDLGELLAEREEYEPALKLISKGQLLAEEIRSLALRARANLLKGNVYRFLKGGNQERAQECLHKGIELLSGENPLPLLWELEYALAKVHQAHLEFADAGACYQRAEKMLERIVSNLPQDMRVAYRDDRRRKLFFDDYRRFQKEATGRGGTETGEAAPEPAQERVWSLPQRTLRSEPTSKVAIDPLLSAIGNICASTSVDEWSRNFLEETRRLVPSPAGALVTVGADGRLELRARRDVAHEEDWLSADQVPGVLIEQARSQGAPVRSGDETWRVQLEGQPRGHAYRNRSLLILPLRCGGRLHSILYLQRPTASNHYQDEDIDFLERFFAAVSGSLESLVRLDELTVVGETGLLSTAGLEEELRVTAERWLDGGPEFFLVRVYLPGLWQRFRDGDPRQLIQRITSVAVEGVQATALLEGDAVIYLCDGAHKEEWSTQLGRLKDELAPLVNEQGPEICTRLHHPDPQMGTGADVARALLRQLQQDEEFSIYGEIEQLTAGGLTLKEAKSTLEKRYITAELFKSRGNITRAAEQLGVHRPQLSNLIKKYNVRREDFE